MMEKFEKKMLKHFVGFFDDRDEYELTVIYRILGKAFMYVFYSLVVLAAVSAMIDMRHHTITFGTIAMGLIWMSVSVYVLIRLRKNRVVNSEYTAKPYTERLRKIRRKSICLSIYSAVVFYLMNDFLNPFLEGEAIQFRGKNVLTALICGIAVGSIMYIYSKTQIKKVADDDDERD